MVKKFDLSRIDGFGGMVLEPFEAFGIEKYLHKLPNGKFYSRNQNYYNDINNNLLTIEQCCMRRNELAALLPAEGARAFVLIENMMWLSAKVMHKELRQHIEGNSTDFHMAKACLDEDAENLVRIIRGLPAKQTERKLPYYTRYIRQKPTVNFKKEKRFVPERRIEQDNKKMIFAVLSALPEKPEYIVTPGLGSIFIGPIARALYGTKYTIINCSMRRAGKLADGLINIDDLKEMPKNIVLFDDNVGTGTTLTTIREQFKHVGITVKMGATEFNWRGFAHETETYADAERRATFNPSDYDYLSYMDYRGLPHHEMQEWLNSVLGMNGQANPTLGVGYEKCSIPNMWGLYKRGESLANKHDVNLDNYENPLLSKSAIDFNRKLLKEIIKIEGAEGKGNKT